MSGVDTVRGINYQHCHALLTALDVAADPALAAIRVEGTDDVLDLEIYALPATGSGEANLIRGLQIKSRMAPYSWAKSELLAIVHRWASVSVGGTSDFEIRTDGELGPSGLAVAAALEAARGGNFETIAELLGVETSDSLCAVAARATIVSDPASVEALLLTAEQEVRARLDGGPHHPDAQEEAEVRVNELFRLISTRSGASDPDRRMITRQELVAVLGGVGQLSAEDRWIEALGMEYAAAAATEGLGSIVVPSLHGRQGSETFTIDELARNAGPTVLAGPTGSGKTTLAQLWRVKASSAGRRLVVCRAESYLPGRLDRAVADAVGDAVRRDLPRQVGRQVLGDDATTIVIDGVSEIPSKFRKELAEELRAHLAEGHGARLVLLGRDEGVCASVLPATRTAARFFPNAFGPAQKLKVAQTVLAESRGHQEPSEGMPDEAHEPGTEARSTDDRSDQECRVALAQVEHALGDAAGNPLLLRLALELVVSGIGFKDRASVYELTVSRMAARANVADIRLASAALGIVFAGLLDEGRRYANPLEWARLLNNASIALAAAGTAITPGEVTEAVTRSGLINASVNGIGQTRLLGPVHDSFADYFAARAHADGLVSLPFPPSADDENRVLLSAQMNMLSAADCLAVAASLPFTLVRLSESDDGSIDDQTPHFIAALLKSVLPAGESSGVTMWRIHDRFVAQVTTDDASWVDSAEAPQLFADLSVVSEPADGPVTIAVRLWRLILRKRLQSQAGLRPPAPRTKNQACSQLIEHSKESAAAIKRLTGVVAPAVAVERLLRTVGPQGMTGVVYDRAGDEHFPAGWLVKYEPSVETELIPAPDSEAGEESIAADFAASGDVRMYLSTLAEHTASTKVKNAINEMTRPHWL